MVQSIVGTDLATTAIATTRQPAAQVLIGWDRTFGWSDTASWTDETANVLGLTLSQQAADTRQGIAIVGNSVAASGTLTLAWANGRFSPHNSGGALYAYIADGQIIGVPVKISLGFYSGANAQTLVQFCGYIVDPGIRSKGGVTFQLQDRAWDFLNCRLSSALYANQDVDDYLNALTALLAVADQPTTDLDQGLFPMSLAWLDDESLWEEMSSVALAQGGMVWLTKAGVLTFRDGSYFARESGSDFTFTTAYNLTQTYRHTDVYNHIIVRWSGGRIGRWEEVWSANEVELLRPAESRTIKARFTQPVYSLATQVAGTDYAATRYDGAEANADLNIAVTAYAQRADLTLTNNGSAPIYVVMHRLRGRPVVYQDMEEVEAEDATSITRYGRRTLDVRPFYCLGRSQAEALRDFLLVRYKVPHALYSMDIPAIPWLEIGDRVTVTEARAGLSAEVFYMVGLQTTFGPRTGYRQTLQLLRATDLYPYSNWFVPGTTPLGAAGGRYFY